MEQSTYVVYSQHDPDQNPVPEKEPGKTSPDTTPVIGDPPESPPNTGQIESD
jgi:hypothetical protein